LVLEAIPAKTQWKTPWRLFGFKAETLAEKRAMLSLDVYRGGAA